MLVGGAADELLDVVPIIDIIGLDAVPVVEAELDEDVVSELDEDVVSELGRELEVGEVCIEIVDLVVSDEVAMFDVCGGGRDVLIVVVGAVVGIAVVPVGRGAKKVVVVNTVVTAFGATIVVTNTVRGMVLVTSPEMKTVVVVSTVTTDAVVGSASCRRLRAVVALGGGDSSDPTVRTAL